MTAPRRPVLAVVLAAIMVLSVFPFAGVSPTGTADAAENDEGDELADFEVEVIEDPVVQEESMDLTFSNAVDDEGEPFTGTVELEIERPGTDSTVADIAFEDGEAVEAGVLWVTQDIEPIEYEGLTVESIEDASVNDTYDVEVVTADDSPSQLGTTADSSDELGNPAHFNVEYLSLEYDTVPFPSHGIRVSSVNVNNDLGGSIDNTQTITMATGDTVVWSEELTLVGGDGTSYEDVLLDTDHLERGEYHLVEVESYNDSAVEGFYISPAYVRVTDQPTYEGEPSIVVEEFGSADGGFLAVYDGDPGVTGGDEFDDDHEQLLGTSSTLDEGSHQGVDVPLDADLDTGAHSLTVIAYGADDRAYREHAHRSYRVDDQVTVTVSEEPLEPAEFVVTEFPEMLAIDEPGDDVGLGTTEVTNIGDETAHRTIELTLDGELIRTYDQTVAGGESTHIHHWFDTDDLEAGETYEYTLSTGDDSKSGTIMVGNTDSHFEIIDAGLPEKAAQGQPVMVEPTVENVGPEFGKADLTYRVIDADDPDLRRDLDVAVVDDSRDTALGEAYVNVLEKEFKTVDLVTNDDVLDEMADYDVIVIYNFVTDTLAEDFLEELEADQGVVYLDDPEIMWPQEYWADGVYRLHNVREDPGHRESITNNASGDPPEVTITAAHPIFDGVGDVGETVILNDNTERATGGSWFGAYSGDIVAEVDYGVHENADVDEEDVRGPGIGVNDDESEVLLPALIHRNELEHLTPEGEALLVNSVIHVNDGAELPGETVLTGETNVALDKGEQADVELVVELPDDIETGTYVQVLETEDDAVTDELVIGEPSTDIEVTAYSIDPDPTEEELLVGDTIGVEALVTNHGSQSGDLEVSFLVDEEVVITETVEVDGDSTETVELDHELRVSGTKNISVNGVDPEQIAVEPGPEASIEVSSHTLDPDPAEEYLFVGDTLTLNAHLTNHGQLSGEYEVEYILDEEVVANETIAIAGSEDTSALEDAPAYRTLINETEGVITLDHELRETGTKIVSANGVDPVQITVESEPEADIEVSSYTLDPDPATEDLFVGDTLVVDAFVTNHGTESGEFEVEYIVDEEVVSNETVEVNADSTKIVELEHELRESGTKIISINGVDPVQMTIEATETPSEGPAPTPTPESTPTPTPTPEQPTPTPTPEQPTPTPEQPTPTPTPEQATPTSTPEQATATPTPEVAETPTSTGTPEPTDTPTATESDDEDTPGFGVAVALITLLASALLAARRRP